MSSPLCLAAIEIPEWGITERCQQGRGHAGPHATPLHTPAGEYVGELEDAGEQDPRSVTIYFGRKGRELTWSQDS